MRIHHMVPLLVRTGLIVVFVLFLEYVGQSRLVSSSTFVPVSDMVRSFVSEILGGRVTPHFVRTAIEAASSFSLAVILGVPFGVILWKYSGLARAFEPYLVSLYSMPMVMFYPVFLMIFGLGIFPIIAVTVIAAVIPVVLNTMIGLSQVPEVFFKLARCFRLNRWQVFAKVLLPATTPFVFAGLRISAIYSLSLTIATEFILADTGIGHRVRWGYEFYLTAEMYGYIMVIIIFAVLLNIALTRGETALRKERL